MTALQCPGCGHIHGDAERGSGRTFRCRGCRRLLSVPVAVAAAESSRDDTGDPSLPLFTGRTAAPERPRPTPGPGRPPVAERQPPRPWGDDTGDLSDPGFEVEARPDAGGERAPTGVAPRPRRTPVWLRAVVWILALAMGLAVTVLVLRAVGVLDVDAVIDTYAERGFRRYTMLLVLVPVWAATASAFAHVALEWVGRRRRAR